jgi:hypothetical protein
MICWLKMLAIWQGQVIQEGQVVCYLEQLGTQQPVEVYRAKILKAGVWNTDGKENSMQLHN